jgi:hypothetical protein
MLVYLSTAIWYIYFVDFIFIWYILWILSYLEYFSRFGMLYEEKSSNPGTCTDEVCFVKFLIVHVRDFQLYLWPILTFAESTQFRKHFYGKVSYLEPFDLR